MLDAASDKIAETIPDSALVLDVGAWHKPFARADWVLDLMPYETRGGRPEGERFSAETWIQIDICARERWPFDDGEFDFAVCSHTLEDVRDPVWVCSELDRVAKAGYIEVPSRLEEQTWGVNGEWVGWSHHHWLVDLADSRAEFTLKPHFLHGRPDLQISLETLRSLDPAARVTSMFWSDRLHSGERIHYQSGELEDYLREPILEAALPTRTEERRSVASRIRAALAPAP